MHIGKILDKGLLVIPKQLRDQMSLSKGDKVEISLSPQGIFIRPLKESSLTEQYRGVAKGRLSLEELEDLYVAR